MKIAGKRIARGTLLLVLGMLTVSLCTILMSAALRANYINEVKNRNFYSSKARKFEISNSDMNSSAWEALLAKCDTDIVLYHQIIDEELDIRAVYGNGISNRPEMQYGRYFEQSDQFQNVSTAVIGQNHKNEIFSIDGNSYFEYQGMQFQVLGIMGGRWESQIDNLIYIDFASGLSLASSDGQYILDGKNSEQIEACLALIETDTNVGRIAVSVQDETPSVVQRYLEGGFGIVIYGLIYLSFFLSVVIIANMWLGYRGRMISIMQMLGFSRAQIFIEMGKSFVYISLASWGVGVFTAFTISYYFPVLSLNELDFLASAVATIITGIAALAIPFWKRSKVEISMGMR